VNGTETARFHRKYRGNGKWRSPSPRRGEGWGEGDRALTESLYRYIDITGSRAKGRREFVQMYSRESLAIGYAETTPPNPNTVELAEKHWGRRLYDPLPLVRRFAF
jgi:hypothetical protein